MDARVKPVVLSIALVALVVSVVFLWPKVAPGTSFAPDLASASFVPNLEWSPDGTMLAYTPGAGLHLLDTTSMEEEVHYTSNEIVSIRWVDTKTVELSDVYNHQDLVEARTGAPRPIEIPPIPNHVRQAHPDGMGFCWLDIDDELIWFSESKPIGEQKVRWVSYIHNLSSKLTTKHLAGVSRIYPSGHKERFVAFYRDCESPEGDVYVLHDNECSVPIGTQCLIRWSPNGQFLAWTDQSGRLQLQQW